MFESEKCGTCQNPKKASRIADPLFKYEELTNLFRKWLSSIFLLAKQLRLCQICCAQSTFEWVYASIISLEIIGRTTSVRNVLCLSWQEDVKKWVNTRDISCICLSRVQFWWFVFHYPFDTFPFFASKEYLIVASLYQNWFDKMGFRLMYE